MDKPSNIALGDNKAWHKITNQLITTAECSQRHRSCGGVNRVNSKVTFPTSVGESASSKSSSPNNESDSNGYDAGGSGESNESSDNASSRRGYHYCFSISSEKDDNSPYESLDSNLESKNPFLVNISDREPPFSSSDYLSSSDDALDRPTTIPTKKFRRSKDPSLSEATTMGAESDEKPTTYRGKKIRPFPYFFYTDYSYIIGNLPNGNGAEPYSQERATYCPLTRPSKPALFPLKLHAILFRDDLTDIITWMPHGRAFKIINIREFELSVLPVYFSSSRVSSFLKDCWEWGFRKVRVDLTLSKCSHLLWHFVHTTKPQVKFC